jgi:hypothetical protein
MNQYLRHTDDPEIIKEIKKAIDSKNCIIVVGSGLSTLASTDDGRIPPKRDELLKHIVKWCFNDSLMDENFSKDLYAAIDSFHLHDAAKEIEELLNDKYLLQRCIRDVTLCSDAKICDVHCLLARIPFRAYFTTNYDKLIETAYSHVKGIDLPRFYTHSIKDIFTYYQQNKPFIVKLNGDIDDPDSIFLVERSQEKPNDLYIENKDGLIWMISKAASLLFIGYDWEDPDINYLLNKISKRSGQRNPHWIMAQEGHFPSFKARSIFNDKGISIIQYNDTQLSLIDFLEKLGSTSPVGRIPGFETTNVTSELMRQTKPGIEIFCSYTHKDEDFRIELEKHLSSLKHEGKIKFWHDRKIIGGEDWENEINISLNRSQIILLLISSDFLNSHYCTGVELKQARDRYDSGLAKVIPVILRDVDWRHYPFGKEQVTDNQQMLGKLLSFPKDSRPVTTWDDKDSAFKDIAEGIRKVIEELIERHI